MTPSRLTFSQKILDIEKITGLQRLYIIRMSAAIFLCSTADAGVTHKTIRE
jgi:hypothetical protein